LNVFSFEENLDFFGGDLTLGIKLIDWIFSLVTESQG
jgi:hypothetical protein